VSGQLQNSPDQNLKTAKGLRCVWKLSHSDTELCQKLSKKFGISLPVTRILVSRGINNPEEISRFLFSNFERDVACSTKLKDAQKAADRIELAISKNEKILLFGDYDVDGMTSVAIAMLSLVPIGAKVNYFLPHREKDGYGISPKAVARAAEAGYGLIITVDNGTTAHQAALKAKEVNIDLIVTDHHQPKEALPEVFALVNPHQPDCHYPKGNFCGAGVIFKLICLIYQRRGLSLPKKVYELLMLGTVADVVPMDVENRYWVRNGLAGLKKNMSYSFFYMAQNAGLNPEKEFWSAQDIGFFIAPQLNALGRLENPRDAVKFLVSSEKEVVEDVGRRLKLINDRRKKIDREIFAQIDRKIKQGSIDLNKERVIMAADKAWPPGVIGLVAGKLMNTYSRPTFLFHLTSQGLAKGSCRSIEQFNVFRALEESKDLLLSFGGHSCAAGLSLVANNLPELKARLERMVSAQVDDSDLVPSLKVDSCLSLCEVGKNLLHDIRMLEPFGNSNPIPFFLIEGVVLVKRPELLKDAHLKCLIFSQGVVKPVMFFNQPELFELFIKNQENPFDLVASIHGNEWGGRTSIDFIGLDVRFHSKFNI